MKHNYWVDEKIMLYLEFYCMGKSRIWNMFFGWRQARIKNNGEEEFRYIVPKRVYELAKRVANGEEI